MKLEVKELACGYGGRVQGVSFALEAGEIICLPGPNGSGKTTLLKTVLGLLPPLGGEVRLNGKRLNYRARRFLAQTMGYVPQNHIPPFPFRVLEVVLMGRTPHLSALASPRDEDLALARRLLRDLGIAHLEERPYTEVSGGERQLVLIARALAQCPRILLLDEPTASLDFGNQFMVLQNLRRLAASGLAVLMTTHFPDHALLYGHRVLLLRGGEVVGYGPPGEVITEESLARLYRVKARIVRVQLDGAGEARICIPLM
ncbi:ABC transporter ATP-binding protein [Ammonifex thiophilus]|uniref:ABC transporter ATP-binding protein n=1 Tax=Ammonifex thiophilus TaxID=444093 RepID=A0A3D8P692_9THEO|nr:ABC transporter ATP-binding protein [Ammonifex thiophilus]RDV84846.1 ABC transporter ATP-binding protein [Ammonifex thiophilus]